MDIHLLYPSSPLIRREPDEQFAAEVEAVRAAGLPISLFSLENFQCGEFRATPAIPASTEVLYRGWMLSGPEYEKLNAALGQNHTKLLISPQEYLANHHLPNWYPEIKDLTPETRIFPADCDLVSELKGLNWPEYFIKDYVKSLKTALGSRFSRPEQVSPIVEEMRTYRGVIEGGFCVRRVEAFLPGTEQRYFVLHGAPHSPSGEIPPIVCECVKRLKNRFYSVDVVQRADGQLRIVEVGDGQVSDLVGWTPTQFTKMLKEHFTPG